MRVVVDTSVLIDHLRGATAAREALSKLVDDGQPLLASVLTRAEILTGMRTDEDKDTRALFDVVSWVPVDSAIADRAGELAARYLRSHPGVDLTDYVIAATAEALGAELWTRNVKHFPMFPGPEAPY